MDILKRKFELILANLIVSSKREINKEKGVKGLNGPRFYNPFIPFIPSHFQK